MFIAKPSSIVYVIAVRKSKNFFREGCVIVYFLYKIVHLCIMFATVDVHVLVVGNV